MATEVEVAFEVGRPARKAPVVPAPRQPAQIARTLALAHALEERLKAGEFRDYADIGRRSGSQGRGSPRSWTCCCLRRTFRRRSCSWRRAPGSGASTASIYGQLRQQ
jgi:hypothetical protein